MRIETKEHNNLHEYIKTLSAIKHHPHTHISSVHVSHAVRLQISYHTTCTHIIVHLYFKEDIRVSLNDN